LTGRLDAAAQHYAEALHHARQLANRFAEADHAEHLADVLAEQGQPDAAQPVLRAAHKLFTAQHRFGDAERVSWKLNGSTDNTL
jgi:hypothetical protein